MRGIEQVGSTGSRQRAELPALPIAAKEVQKALILFAYCTLHDRKDIKPTAWEENGEEAVTAAMEDWLRTGPNGQDPLSAKYRTYVKAHPDEQIESMSDEELKKLLGKIKEEGTPSETLH